MADSAESVPVTRDLGNDEAAPHGGSARPTATRSSSLWSAAEKRPGEEAGAMLSWAHAGPSVLASFLASLVEFIEALTVVLAVGTVRGWRSALAGTGLALAVLALLVLALGPALARIPLPVVQV